MCDGDVYKRQSVINLVLDLLFITGFHTGVGGAAVATVISQIVSALLCFWQLLRTKESYGLKIRKIRFDKGILVQIIKIGLDVYKRQEVYRIANS